MWLIFIGFGHWILISVKKQCRLNHWTHNARCLRLINNKVKSHLLSRYSLLTRFFPIENLVFRTCDQTKEDLILGFKDLCNVDNSSTSIHASTSNLIGVLHSYKICVWHNFCYILLTFYTNLTFHLDKLN